MMNNRKAILTKCLMVGLIAILLLTLSGGCAKPENENGDENVGNDPVSLTIRTAAIGGNMHIIGGALGKLIEMNIPGSTTTVEPGGSGSNPITVSSGDAEIGTTMYSNAVQAFDGVPPYEEPIKNVGAIANLNIRQWICFVTTNKNFSSLREMIEAKYPMKLVLGQPGSTSEVLIAWILEAYGVDYDVIKSWGGSVTHVSPADSVNLMKDGHADVFATIPSLQLPAVVDLCMARDVKFLPIDKEIVDKVAEDKGLLTGSLPAKTYKGQEEDYYSLMETQIIIANTDIVSDELAYEITKLLVENADYMKNAHSDMNTFDPKIASTNTGFPLHPGSAAYFEELDAK
ncbi:MAG: TAXI family TRAP transporter solute-binding subunit [Firmicutes bacterium]|nr:TAXI family TRAP transporter solute-binding subunit [Bacillota bacterium]